MIQFDSNLIFSYGHILYFYANMIKVNKKMVVTRTCYTLTKNLKSNNYKIFLIYRKNVTMSLGAV